MTIERDSQIKFHEQGTLNAVTRWVATHDEGIAEWLKNVRRTYQVDRSDVADEHRAAVLLLKDENEHGKARIGLLDVGGATLDDVSLWSTWQDPDASGRGSGVPEEETQGNGGKAYMYRLFRGIGRIFGVRSGRRNCKGFEGPEGTVERGTPGFMPDAASGRDVPDVQWRPELERILEPYGMTPEMLPEEVVRAISEREAFTLVEAVDPDELYLGRIDSEELVRRVIRHDQSTLAIQQLRLYANHNGRPLNGGGPLELETIAPYPGLEEPRIFPVPDELRRADGQLISTREGGSRGPGRLILYTSKENMWRGYKNLRPRWRITYRTDHTMVGSKLVSELVPATAGSYFTYGTVELPALEPDYVEHGRRRPKDGPLVEALDLFVAEKIKEVAKEITDQRRHDHDEQSLDEVHQENQMLDRFKNRFLSDTEGHTGPGPGEGDGDGPEPPPPPPPPETGETPDHLDLGYNEPVLRTARGVQLQLAEILRPTVRDAYGKRVPGVPVEFHLKDPHVVRLTRGGHIEAINKGETEVWAQAAGTSIESQRVRVQVWDIDHVLLTPRDVHLLAGHRTQIIAEVTSDEGARATDTYLNWEHDAEDQLIVRVSPSGWVTGNRQGRTRVRAGAGNPEAGGVWARIPAEVTVEPNPELPARGGGYPRLLITGRDLDPATGEIRAGDPDAPVLWQETSDYVHNVWWLNLDSPEASFAFDQKSDNPEMWRQFHVQKLIEMVVQVRMQEEYTRRGEQEQRDFWVSHKAALDRHQVVCTQQMWDELDAYVKRGEELDG